MLVYLFQVNCSFYFIPARVAGYAGACPPAHLTSLVLILILIFTKIDLILRSRSPYKKVSKIDLDLLAKDKDQDQDIRSAVGREEQKEGRGEQNVIAFGIDNLSGQQS